MEYDINKIALCLIGLLASLYTAFSESPVALKLKPFANLTIAGVLIIIVAVAFNVLTQGKFDFTNIIDFLSLRKIGGLGLRKILSLGYSLFLWGLPVLLFSKKDSKGG